MAFEAFLSIAVAAVLFFLYKIETAKPEKEQEWALRVFCLYVGLGLLVVAFFIDFDLTGNSTTTSYPAYNITTSNVPLNCVDTGTLVLGAPVVDCGTTTEIEQHPEYNVTSTVVNSYGSPPFDLTALGFAFGLIIMLIIVFIPAMRIFGWLNG